MKKNVYWRDGKERGVCILKGKRNERRSTKEKTNKATKKKRKIKRKDHFQNAFFAD